MFNIRKKYAIKKLQRLFLFHNPDWHNGASLFRGKTISSTVFDCGYFGASVWIYL
jgi:hypothetical protein